MPASMIDLDALISDRAKAIDVSGIRRVFELGAKLENPINLSIGQPDFPVPEPLKKATIEAIRNDKNGYTLTQGIPELRDRIGSRLAAEVGWDCSGDDLEVMITSGTSGALLLSFLAVCNPGDEAIIPDPYFVIYPALGELTGVKIVPCDLYPDFRMTAERVEPHITDRTRILLLNTPGNPTGTVLTSDELRELVELCTSRGVLIVSDEIYDAFTYADALEDGVFPTPARFTQQMLLVRGYGKSYGCTGWRMGYAAGPTPIIRQMSKLQQYTFVCAPSMAQHGMVGAFDVDLSPQIAAYRAKRDIVVEGFRNVTEIETPGGAFYAFVKIPAHLGMTATEFVEKALEQNVLTIPGAVFSRRDTHFRISYAAPDGAVREGVAILSRLMR